MYVHVGSAETTFLHLCRMLCTTNYIQMYEEEEEGEEEEEEEEEDF